MKYTRHLSRLLILAVAAILLVTARATTFIWDGGLSHGNFTLNDLWATANNWQTTAPVSSADTAIVFKESGAHTTATQNLGAPFVLNSLTFDAASNVTLLSGNQLNFVVLPATLLAPSLTQSSSTDVTISAGVLLNDSQMVFKGDGSGSLTISGTITGAGGGFTKIGTSTLILSGNNTYTGTTALGGGTIRLASAGSLGSSGPIQFNGGNGTLQYSANNQTDYSNRFLTTGGQAIRIDTGSQNITFATAIVGSGTSLTKLGTGTLTLTGAGNTYNGLTSVLAGTLILNKSGGLAVPGDLSIGNAVNPGAAGSAVLEVDLNSQTSAQTNVSIFSDGVFFNNGKRTEIGSLTMTDGEIQMGNSQSGLRGFLTINGNVTVNAGSSGARVVTPDRNNDLDLHEGTRTFNVARGTALYDFDVQAGISEGTLIKTGAGVMRMAGKFNTGLAVILQAGTIAIAEDQALGTGAFLLTPAAFTLAGGTLVADGGDRAMINALNLTGSATIGASLDGTPHAVRFTGASTVTNSLTLTVSNNALTSLGDVALGANTLTLAGTGDVTIGGAITGSGGLVKTGGGQLTLNGTSSFSGGLSAVVPIIAKSGSSLGAAGNIVTLVGGNPLTFTDQAVTVRQVFQLGTSTLTPATGGQITYVGASVINGFLGSGQHVVNDGTLLNGVRIGSGAVIRQDSGSVTFQNVLLTGNATFTQAAGATLATTGDFTANPATALTLDGTMNTQGASFSGAVTIHSGATLVNTGSPLYLQGSRGAKVDAGGVLKAEPGSSIELGGLLVNNGTQTGALHINLSGVLKGSGVFGAVTVGEGGLFSPGNSPGSATVESLSLTSGGRYQFELNSALATPGNGADFLEVLGTLDITAGTTPGSVFTISIVSLNAGNAPAALLDFDPNQSYSYLLVTAAGGITGFDAAKFSVETGGFANNLAGGSFAVEQSGHDLVLNFTPAPEPGTTGLLCGGTLWLLGRRRRRKGI